MDECGGNRLPRLLVVSDVNVERTVSGALVLYRLLKHYPVGKLMVISQPRQGWAHPMDRVTGAEYRDVRYGIPRWLLIRFNPFWPVGMAYYIHRLTPGVLAEARQFRPEAVLGVTQDYLCFVADAVAKRLQIPLHLILHDDWTFHQTLRQPSWTKPAVQWACDRVIGSVLRRATTRFCVSPGMAERYAMHYQVASDVLYPCRGEDSLAPMLRVKTARPQSVVVAYTGTIHHAWVVASLRAMATVMATIGGRLELYVPYPDSKLTEWGLVGPHIQRIGFFPANEMAERVAATAHVLFLPASFGEEEMVDVSTLFPSKLCDYTAIGLPVLIWGPQFSSAARWASDNPGGAELVTDPAPAALQPAIERLADPAYATRVAKAGIVAGLRDFDLTAIQNQFLAAITPRKGAPTRRLEGREHATAKAQYD